eukprot:2378671-Pyramimonas_sp.AAC.1
MPQPAFRPGIPPAAGAIQLLVEAGTGAGGTRSWRGPDWGASDFWPRRRDDQKEYRSPANKDTTCPPQWLGMEHLKLDAANTKSWTARTACRPEV